MLVKTKNSDNIVIVCDSLSVSVQGYLPTQNNKEQI